MFIKHSILIFTSIIVSMLAFGQIKYPATKKVAQEDNYFGTKISDPYRWLENDNSDETKAWVEAENKITRNYLSAIPYRSKVKEKLEAMWNFPTYSPPFREGGYYYIYKNDGLQNQSVLYRQKGLSGVMEVFIDPNKLSKDGTAAVGNITFSRNKKYAAYTVAEAGSDWEKAFVMEVESKKLRTDQLDKLKFTGLSWKQDDGFYYSRFPDPEEKTKMTDQNHDQKLYYHKLGTPQSADKLIYEDKSHPQRFVGGYLTEDGRFLIIQESEGTSGSQILVQDQKTGQTDFTMLVKGFDTEASVIDNDGDRLLVRTNAGAPNYQVVSIDPKSLAMSDWKTIIPTRTKLLEGVNTAGHRLFLSYLEDASSRIYQTKYSGELEREIRLPGIGTATGFGANKEDQEVFYSYTSFNQPPNIYRQNIATGANSLFHKSEAKINADDFKTLQTFFTSKDGTKVPMFITYKKGMKLDGNNPTLITGYGGFNIPVTPSFGISNAFFLQQGGIFVLVTLRGGSEYGEDWHKAGMLENKQHVFDDMIAAAEFLIEKKYTNSSKLAMRGGSNGGLLVGAVMTQRPELFKVAIPQVGVMDMLRYHTFTIGHAWATEYGSSDKEADFRNLVRYSPLHNLKPGTAYPATLVTTADHDDRVVPAHSFKFAATLQAANSGPNPALIRIDSRAGHGGGKPISKVIEEQADIWSFVMYNLGMTYKD